MSKRSETPLQSISPRSLVHQEGVLALAAVVGLLLSDRELAALLPKLGWTLALAWGFGVGLAVSATLWLLRSLPPARELDSWLATMMQQWTVADALAIAVISGLAEEALIRALLQPLIGLVPAAMLFALLHIFPNKRLWFWPIMALVIGIVLGLLFEHFGYPAAAAAHVAINAVGLVRLTRLRQTGDLEEQEEQSDG